MEKHIHFKHLLGVASLVEAFHYITFLMSSFTGVFGQLQASSTLALSLVTNLSYYLLIKYSLPNKVAKSQFFLISC